MTLEAAPASSRAAARAGHALRIERAGDAVHLEFPPLRSIGVALPLALFGALAAVVPGAAVAALLPSLVANAGNLLAAVLIGGFVLPFVVFGAILVAVAVYIVANALRVRVDAQGIETARLVFGVVLRRHRLARADIAAIEPQIPTRYQTLFAAEPSYHLYARSTGGTRIVVAETLRGERAMHDVKALLENPAANFDQENDR